MNKNRATIDIGSNSILLLLAQVDPFKEIAKLSEVTSLGKGLDREKKFRQEPMDESFKALKSYVELCQQHNVPAREIIATATEASRVATNAGEFFAKVKEELGLDVKIISGVKEAELTAKGILFNTQFTSETVVIMDIGGASTELIKVNTKTKTIISSISLKVGSVRVSDWLAEGVFTNALSKLLPDNSLEIDSYLAPTLYCVAGTLTSLGNMHLERKEFIEDDVHGLEMKRTDIEKMFQKYSEWTPEQFLEKFPFLGKRAGAIRGGLTLATHLVQRLKVQEVVVSTYGLRFGSFIEGAVE